jgi:hypothetical protein
MNRRQFLQVETTLIASALAGSSRADGTRTYVALSLIGDRLDIVTHRPQTGSNLDKNEHAALPLTDTLFDAAALKAVAESVEKSQSKASVVLLAASSPKLYARQEGLFDGSRLVIPDDIRAALAKEKATHLILLTKHRGEANLQSANGLFGSGKLEGLGFYIDSQHYFRRTDTGELAQGCLAPFVYIRLSLVDLQTFEVMKTEVVTKTATLSAARSSDMNPWNALTQKQKVEMLLEMLGDEVSRVVPTLVRV